MGYNFENWKAVVRKFFENNRERKRTRGGADFPLAVLINYLLPKYNRKLPIQNQGIDFFFGICYNAPMITIVSFVLGTVVFAFGLFVGYKLGGGSLGVFNSNALFSEVKNKFKKKGVQIWKIDDAERKHQEELKEKEGEGELPHPVE